MHASRLSVAFSTLAFLVLAVPTSAADWGTIKGKVTWGGAKMPVLDKIVVDADPKECNKFAPLFQKNYDVDQTTKGVRYVVVYLYTDAKVKPPIHPDLVAVKEKKVFLDQPCCAFEPRVLCIRKGQILEAKNSAPMPHNIKIDGGRVNPNINNVIAPKAHLDVDGWNPSPYAVPFSCGVHKWMRGFIRVFDHPYYAVTNAKGEFEIKNVPAGNWNLVVWHEEGFVVGDKKGVPIVVKKDKTTELKYEMKPGK